MTQAVGLLTVGTAKSSTGFVTFKSLTSAATASQALLTAQPFVFKVQPAPEPRDILWHNVGVPLTQVRLGPSLHRNALPQGPRMHVVSFLWHTTMKPLDVLVLLVPDLADPNSLTLSPYGRCTGACG